MFSPLEDYRKLSSMDREILFRGKRIDNGEWVEGNFCAVEKLDCSGDEYFIIEHAANGGQHQVDPETVGQYTGRTAQCKDKIFEGDRCIVTTFDHEGADYQHECVVVWDDGCLAFSGENNEFWMPVAYIEDTDSDVEVIGNIHDTEATPCTE